MQMKKRSSPMAAKRRGRIIEKKQNRGIKRPVDDSSCDLASLRSDKYHAASEKPSHDSSIKPKVGRGTLSLFFSRRGKDINHIFFKTLVIINGDTLLRMRKLQVPNIHTETTKAS